MRTESTPIKRWTESDALDPMFEKPQKAQVVRTKIETVSLDFTSMAPLLMDRCSPVNDRRGRQSPTGVDLYVS